MPRATPPSVMRFLLPGMALAALGRMVNLRKTRTDSPEWQATTADYLTMMNEYGPPGASSNGFNENLSLFQQAVDDLMVEGDRVVGAVTQVGLRFLEIAARRCLAGQAPGARDPVTPFGEGRGARKAARQWLDLIDKTSAWDDFHRPGASVPELRALHLPTLLMYADGSRCLKSGDGLRNLWPSAHFQTVEAAAHFFPLTHADLVIHQVLDFLAPLNLTEA